MDCSGTCGCGCISLIAVLIFVGIGILCQWSAAVIVGVSIVIVGVFMLAGLFVDLFLR